MFSVAGFAQPGAQDSLRLSYWVQGTVFGGDTYKGVESALVSIPDGTVATVTNSDGRFVIKSPKPFNKIRISHLGYETEVREVSHGESVKVKLKPLSFTLEGAKIISGDPEGLVRAAIERIAGNYGREASLLECFYRETVRKRTRYIYISEAVSRIYKTGYDRGVERDRCALEKSRVLISPRASDTLSVKVQGGPAQAAQLDVVKNWQMLFDNEEMKLYTFEMGVPTYIAGRLQFVINFRPTFLLEDRALYYGTLYIDQELLYFTRIEMSMDMSDPALAARQMVVSKPATLRLTPKEMTIVVNYSESDGVVRLSYFRSVFRFNCDWRKRLLATNYTAVNELVVTDLLSPADPIARSEAFRTQDVLSDKAAEFLDPDFWKDYNIIEPSESLEHAVDRLRKGR
ncbi:MAG: carboxypeptidase-like regulatory domain-containing protein [Bacteroidales bacterium]|nr:carboxypeptidase-like regulatory domain-containing protein [Bacteroidales bacterium]